MVGGLDGAGLELTDHQVAGLTIDEREHAVLVGEVADDRITFEVADSAAVVYTGGSLGEAMFASETTSGNRSYRTACGAAWGNNVGAGTGFRPAFGRARCGGRWSRD